MDTLFGIEALSDPSLLARRQSSRSVMASSYDRRGGNHDWSNYVRREGRAAVMMDAEGPGCVTRIWTADPQKGVVRVLIDGECKYEMPFAQLFEALPLTSGIGGESAENYARAKSEHLPMGFTSYCPIPFERHCKITIEPEDDYLYYQVGASLYPAGTVVGPSVQGVEKAADVLRRWSEGAPLIDMSDATPTSHQLAAGKESLILERKGAGMVKGLRVSLPPDLGKRELKHLRENLWLVAHFDDDEARDPSIRAPLGAFFLDYGQSPRPRSLFLGVEGESEYYCFFAMPFQVSASLKLVNEGILGVDVKTALLVDATSEPVHELLRFRASWHVETPFGPDHRDYEGLACRLLNLSGHENVDMLFVQGGGHFVGCGFAYDLTNAPTDRAAGESDEMFFVDDDPRLTLYGTGLEDYTNDAWGMSGFAGPLAGDAKGSGGVSDAHLFGYRMHLPDPVPFVRKGRFTFEHGTGNNCSGEVKSVAYWYMEPGHSRTRIEERRWEAIRTGQRKANEEAV